MTLKLVDACEHNSTSRKSTVCLPLHACVRVFYPAVHCFLSLVFDSPIPPRLHNSLSPLFQFYCGIEWICDPFCSVLVTTHMIVGLAVTFFGEMADVCVHTFAPWHGGFWLTMPLKISFFRISHGLARSGHIFSHRPSPPYLVFQVPHILVSPCAYASVDPGLYMCLSIPFPLSSVFIYLFITTCISFTVAISQCCTCMCISIHSLWCDGLSNSLTRV